MSENNQQPAGEAQNSQKKEWYKKWWGVLIVLAIWPLFAIWYIIDKTQWDNSKKGLAIIGVLVLATVMYTSNHSSETPSPLPADLPAYVPTQVTKQVEQTNPQTPQNTPLQFTFDVPSLIGKNIDEVVAALGKPSLDEAPTKQQISLGLADTWEKEFTKNDVTLLVTYNFKDKTVMDFFLGGDDKAKLLIQGNLQEKSDVYVVEAVKAIIDANKITGVKVMKKLPAELDANVTFSAVAFKIDNQESYDWRSCKFEINSKFFSGGYEYTSSKGINAKDSLIISFSEFTKDSKRFDFLAEKPEKLFISCDTMGQRRTNFFQMK